jgi:sugar lactone lactonase YvrE
VPNRRLLIGDLGTGQVFEFDLESRKSRVLSRVFQSPQALLISATSDVLYVADASRRKIYVIDLKRKNTPPKVFSALAEFRSPSGLARLEDGRIIVSDDEAGKLFVLSQNGELQSTFRH